MITAIEDFVDKDDRDAIAGYGAIFNEPSTDQTGKWPRFWF
jgi:hypothetical protein